MFPRRLAPVTDYDQSRWLSRSYQTGHDVLHVGSIVFVAPVGFSDYINDHTAWSDSGQFLSQQDLVILAENIEWPSV